MKERLLLFDIVRSLCVLYVVAFYHMTDYVSNGIWIRYGQGWVASTVMACFVFISGFFLGKRRLDCKSFYLSRLRRFFVPLVLTSILLSLGGWFDSIEQFVFTITGLSCFFLPQPPTLWFFSMIIVFYFLTPFIVAKADANKLPVLIRGTVCMAVFLLFYRLDMLDNRLLDYFPFYVTGLVTTEKTVFRLVGSIKITLLCLLVLYTMLTYSECGSFPSLLIVHASAMVLIMTFSFYIGKYSSEQIKILFSQISYASMFAYLFHRGIYGAAAILFRKYLDSAFLPWSAVAFIIIIIFVISWFAQKMYDKFLLGK